MMLHRSLLVALLLICFSIPAAAQDAHIDSETETPRPPKVISGGMLNGKAVELPKPVYPSAAKAVRASGAVNVQVMIDEEGNVVSAEAVSGHPLLRAASVKAARLARFSPTLLSGQPVRVSGVLVYNFVGPQGWRDLGREFGAAEADLVLPTALGLKLPEGFEYERDELKYLADKQLANAGPDEIKSGIGKLISSIEGKLAADAQNLFEFELGVTVERILGSIKGDKSDLRTRLFKLRELLDRNQFMLDNTRTRLDKAASYAIKAEFTEADLADIAALLQDIR